MKFRVFICFILLLISSCNRGKNTIAYKMKKLYQTEITIPQLEDCIFYGQDSTWKNFIQAKTKLIIYYDSTVCTSCKLSKLWNWEKVICYAKEKDFQFQPYFIICPPKEKIGEILAALEKYPFEWPIYLDYNRIFYNSNPNLPEEPFFHTFLLGTANKVCLIGDPLLSDDLWTLYQKKINSILAN